MNRVAWILAVLAAACGSATTSNTSSTSPRFLVTVTTDATADEPISVGVSALKAAGSVDVAYLGTVNLTTKDGSHVEPASISFGASDQGQKTVSVSFNVAGTHTVFASERRDERDDFDGNAGKAVRIGLFLSPSAAAGSIIVGQVVAFDKHDNVVKNFEGTVRFTSTDPNATLPPDLTFSINDKGAQNVALRLVTAGRQTITAAQVGGTVSSGSASVTVRPGAASRINLDLASNVTVDTNVSVAVTVPDAFGNVATSYMGRVHFVVTDANATAIPDVTFTAAMAGVANVTLQFGTAGDQSIIATDTANASATGSAETRVKAGRTATYTLPGLPSAALAGEPLALIITAVDVHGNVATDYAGSASVTSTDPTDRLPRPST